MNDTRTEWFAKLAAGIGRPLVCVIEDGNELGSGLVAEDESGTARQ